MNQWREQWTHYDFRISDKKWYEAGATEGDRKFNRNLKNIIKKFLVERAIIEFRRVFETELLRVL